VLFADAWPWYRDGNYNAILAYTLPFWHYDDHLCRYHSSSIVVVPLRDVYLTDDDAMTVTDVGNYCSPFLLIFSIMTTPTTATLFSVNTVSYSDGYDVLFVRTIAYILLSVPALWWHDVVVDCVIWCDWHFWTTVHSVFRLIPFCDLLWPVLPDRWWPLLVIPVLYDDRIVIRDSTVFIWYDLPCCRCLLFPACISVGMMIDWCQRLFYCWRYLFVKPWRHFRLRTTLW